LSQRLTFLLFFPFQIAGEAVPFSSAQDKRCTKRQQRQGQEPQRKRFAPDSGRVALRAARLFFPVLTAGNPFPGCPGLPCVSRIMAKDLKRPLYVLFPDFQFYARHKMGQNLAYIFVCQKGGYPRFLKARLGKVALVNIEKNIEYHYLIPLGEIFLHGVMAPVFLKRNSTVRIVPEAPEMSINFLFIIILTSTFAPIILAG